MSGKPEHLHLFEDHLGDFNFEEVFGEQEQPEIQRPSPSSVASKRKSEEMGIHPSAPACTAIEEPDTIGLPIEHLVAASAPAVLIADTHIAKYFAARWEKEEKEDTNTFYRPRVHSEYNGR